MSNMAFIKKNRLIILFFIFFILSSQKYYVIQDSYALDSNIRGVDRYDFDIIEDDQFSLYIKPIVEFVLIDLKPLDAGEISYALRMNYTDPLFGEATTLIVLPESVGKFNITITFYSDKTWDYTLGIYPRNIDFYYSLYGDNLETNGYFVILQAPFTRPFGNWSINIILTSQYRSPPVIFIELPTPVNLSLLITAAAGIIYCNIFALLDTYFKNKKEIVSNKRWIVVAVIILISVFVIYQLYNFTTFSLSKGI
jgi:hypothetical protein